MIDESAVLDPGLSGSTGAMTYGTASSVGYRTDFIELKSGAMQRVARWGNARMVFDLTKLAATPEKLANLRTFFRARGGGARGFRLRDINDYTSTASGMLPGDGEGHVAITALDQSIGTGDGATVDFQLVKRYTDGGNTEVRAIEKPVAATVLIAVAGVSKTVVTDYMLDSTTGIITFGTAPTLGQAVTAGFQFHVPVCFGPGTDKALTFRRDNWGTASVPSTIMAIELIGESPVADDLPLGGAAAVSLSAVPYSWSPGLAHNVMFTPSAAATVNLPLASTMPGSYRAYFENTSASFTIAIKSGGVLVHTLAVSTKRTLIVSHNGTAKVWKAY